MSDIDLSEALEGIHADLRRPAPPPELRERIRLIPSSTPQQRGFLPSPWERFGSMFNATKFVVAGAIVALFAGFLLAGVLTQPDAESVPAAGVSATPEPTTSYVVTSVPLDRSLSPFDSVATADGLWVPRSENIDSDDRFFRDVVHIDQSSGIQATVQGLPEEGFDRLVPVDDAVWAIGSQAAHRIDGASFAVTDSVEFSTVSDEYGSPLVAHGSLWLTSSRSRSATLVEIDLTTRSVRGEYETDGDWWPDNYAPGLVAVDDAIWVHSFAGREGQRLTRFDLERRAFTDTVDVPGVGSWDCCVAVDEAIWLVEQTGTLRRFDLETLEVTDTLRLDSGGGRQIIGSLFADGAIWVGADDVNRIDPETRAVTDVIEVGPREKPAFLHGAIWVANHLGGRGVSRIDPETRQLTHTLEVPAKYLHTPLASSDVIWLYTQENRLFRIDRAETPMIDATAPPPEEQLGDDTSSTPELLPGVDLVTKEVEPGVLQVISDGVRNLSIPVSVTERDLDHGQFRQASKIVVAPDESVWVFGPQGFFRVGEGTTHEGKVWSVVDVDADGTVWALREPGDADDDGYGDSRHKDLSTFDGERWIRKARKVVDFELHPDGETFIVFDSNDGSGGPGLHASIGPVHDDAWKGVGVVEPWNWGGMTMGEGFGGFAINPRATPGAPYPGYVGWAVDGRGLLHDIQFDPSGDGGGGGCCSTEGRVVGLGYGNNGTSWVHLRFDLPVMNGAELTTESAYFLARFDAYQGTPSATYESETISYPDHGPLGGEIAKHLDVAPDGSVWLPSDDGLARFDGRTWMWFLKGNIIEDVDIASNGTVWVQANDLMIGPQSPPASDQDPTTRTYVLTPEAVAADE